jgi:predicted dienelactone hydrolase
MKKTGFAFIVLALSSCLLGSGQLSVVYAQAPSMADLGTAPDKPDLTNDPSVRHISPADNIQAKSADLFRHQYRVGHFTRVLNVPGTRGENRSVNVHLWYPSLSSEDCEYLAKSQADSGSSDADSGSSDANEDDKDCSGNPSVYTSRLYGIPLSQWDALSWTIGSTTSFENLRISRERRFPVIIFSPGNQQNAIDYVYALETLASFGFIVAAPDHVNDTQDDVRIDFIDSQAGFPLPIDKGKPCFDDLPSPCEILDRVKAENSGKDPVVPCPQDSLISSTTADVLESLTDRVRDVGAIIDALPTWFGHRADTSRVGVMGHSRGTVTALAAAGGSKCWGFNAEPRVKAIMALAIGGRNITFGVDVPNITVPALLVAGGLDKTAPASISKDVFNMLGSTEKAFILIPNAEHRHFEFGMCAQTQSAGAIAEANPRAILDLQRIRTLLIFPNSGVAMDFCGFDTFTKPTDIRPLVEKLSEPPNGPPGSGFNVTPDNVPTTGLSSDAVKDEVIQLAVIFFGHVLDRDHDHDPPFTDFLP